MSKQTMKPSSIRKKLISGFALIIFFTLLYFTTSYLLVHENQKLIDQAINKQFNTSIFISKLAIDGQKLRRYEKEYFIYLDNNVKRLKYLKEWSEAKSNIQNRLEVALSDNSNTWNKSEKTTLQTWLKSLLAYSKGFNSLTKKVTSAEITNTIDANIAIREGKNAFRVFLTGTSTLGAKKFDDARKSVIKINQNFKFINIAMFITSILGFLILIIILRKVSNAVEKPIKDLTKSADEMSKGKINQEIYQPNIVEFQGLHKSLERLRISQKTMIDRMMNK